MAFLLHLEHNKCWVEQNILNRVVLALNGIAEEDEGVGIDLADLKRSFRAKTELARGRPSCSPVYF